MFPSRPLPATDPPPAPPLPHASTHAAGQSDEVSLASIGAAASSLNLTAGFGLLGGGNLTSNRSFAVDTDVFATRALLAAVQNGLSPKGTVYSAERGGNVILSGTRTVGGIVVPDDKIVLVTAQSTGSQNGLWVTGAGAWTRPGNSASGATINSGAHVYVESHGGSSDGYQYYLSGGDLDLTVDLDTQVWAVYQLPTLPAPGSFPAVPYSPLGGGSYVLSPSTGGANLALATNDAVNALQWRRYMPAELIYGVNYLPQNTGQYLGANDGTITYVMYGQGAYVGQGSNVFKVRAKLSPTADPTRLYLGSVDGFYGPMEVRAVGASFHAAGSDAGAPWMAVDATRMSLNVPAKLKDYTTGTMPGSPLTGDVVYVSNVLFPSGQDVGGPVYRSSSGWRRFSDDLPHTSPLGEGYLYPTAADHVDVLHVGSTAYFSVEGWVKADADPGRVWSGSLLMYYEDGMVAVVDGSTRTVSGDATLLGTPTASGTSGDKTVVLPFDEDVTGVLHILRL